MGWSPYYPAGVTDEMIAELFGEDGSCCGNCRFYDRHSGICEKKAEAEDEDVVDEMTDEEYTKAFGYDVDECCDDYEYNDALDTPDWTEY